MRAVHSLVLALACVAIVAAPSASDAQPASAIGAPLPDDKLAPGTVTVRVIDGTPSKPVVGTEVTLLVNGQPRQARTDAAGRATFASLPVGAQVQAKIVDANKKAQTSSAFPVPAQGGARVMLSVSEVEGGSAAAMTGGAPMAGAGMPSAREVSGQPRPDRGTPAGTYVVRLTHNGSMAGTDGAPAAGTPVFLVGYAANDSVKVLTLPVDANGRATFTDLDMTGATAYYALASLPRPPALDRMIAIGAVLDGRSGARVVLSGEKRDSTAPAVDDYAKLIPRDPRPVPAGKVRVTLDGVAPVGSPITLFDARTGKPIGTQAAKEGEPDMTQVAGDADLEDDPALTSGTLEVVVTGGAGNKQDPLAGVQVELVDTQDQPITPSMASDPVTGITFTTSVTTGADGKARIIAPPVDLVALKYQVKAKVTVNGKLIGTQPMDLKAGKRLSVRANWPNAGRPEVTFEVAPTPGQVLYAEATMSGQKFRSLPFLNLPEVGMHVNVYVFPRTLYRFDLHAFVEDKYLAFQGDMQVTNYSWAPYQATADGLEIPLPKGHKGAGVGPDDQDDVAVTEGLGFRILRPIPPGGRTFRMRYSMEMANGAVEWAQQLPLGVWKSELKMRQTPNMRVTLPAGIRGSTQRATTGEPWFVVTDITIDRGKTLAFTVSGFPAPPLWKVWAPRIVGIFVILIVIAGVAAAFGRVAVALGPAVGGVATLVMIGLGVRAKVVYAVALLVTAAVSALVGVLLRPARTSDPEAARLARRSQLLDELVALERKGEGGSRKEQLLAELEKLWTKP